MRCVTSIFFASLVVASPVPAATVGNFSVRIDKDPFGEADRYIAVTEQNDAALFVRCLNGKVALAFGVMGKQAFGAEASIKLRVDDGPIVETVGKVVTADVDKMVIQTGDLAFVETMTNAKTLAFKYGFGAIGAFHTFKLRSPDKIVAGAKKACRAP